MTNLKEKIISEIKKIYDPEIPVNIYELGLIYKIEISKENNVLIVMFLFLIYVGSYLEQENYIQR